MRKSRGLSGLAATLISLLAPITGAQAFDWSVTGHVKVIEGSYAPDMLPFQLDVAAGSCPVGSWLWWNNHGTDIASKIANNQGVMAVLVAAKTAGGTVSVFGNNSGCTVDFIWFN